MSIDHVATFEKCFKEELELIKSPRIREFTLFVVKKYCQDSFWTMPTSSSGKFHPAIVNEEGGMVKHVKLCVAIATELIRAWDYPLEIDEDLLCLQYDAIYAACLLHDLYKNLIPFLCPVKSGLIPNPISTIS